MSTSQFKEIMGVSLKYLIPRLEYFDARNVAIRIGEIRKLRGVSTHKLFLLARRKIWQRLRMPTTAEMQ
ncbi:SelB C-terminal domain-containing protein [Desulfobacter hydrogenophilus]|nr:SelB C-terminal domain-containing protein [Desulfobacter hydrogenophilus]